MKASQDIAYLNSLSGNKQCEEELPSDMETEAVIAKEIEELALEKESIEEARKYWAQSKQEAFQKLLNKITSSSQIMGVNSDITHKNESSDSQLEQAEVAERPIIAYEPCASALPLLKNSGSMRQELKGEIQSIYLTKKERIGRRRMQKIAQHITKVQRTLISSINLGQCVVDLGGPRFAFPQVEVRIRYHHPVQKEAVEQAIFNSGIHKAHIEIKPLSRKVIVKDIDASCKEEQHCESCHALY